MSLKDKIRSLTVHGGNSSDIKGIAWNTVGSSVYAASTMLLLAIVSRFVSLEQSGDFSFAYSLSQYLYIVGLFGANYYQMTDFSRRYSYGAYRLLKLISSALMFICGLCYIALTGLTGLKAALTVLLTAYMLIHSYAELHQSVMFQNNRLDLSGSSLFWRTVISLALFCCSIALTRDLIISCAVLAVGNAVSTALITVRTSAPFRKNSSAAERSELISLTRACLPLFSSELLINWMLFFPRFLLERTSDSASQAIFNMIFIPVQIINLLGSFIFKPTLPGLHKAAGNRDPKGFTRLMLMQTAYIGGIAAVAAFFAYIAGIPLLSWFYGVGLSGHLADLMLVIAGGTIFALCQMIYYSLVVLRLQRAIMLIYIIDCLASLPIVIALTRRMAITGAILSFAVSHVMLLIMYIAVLAYNVSRMGRKRALPDGE